MTREIANVTATFDGELVEEEDDVSKVALCSLVGAGDCGSTSTVTVHEIHDEDEFADVRRRYSNEFEEVVTMDVDGEDKDDDPDEDGHEENITELVDEPTLINAADDISIDRWTKYGHDRLYINGGRIDLYIDLEEGTLGDNGGAKTSIEFDGDVVTVTMGEEGKSHYRYDEVVIGLSGDIRDSDNEASDGDSNTEGKRSDEENNRGVQQNGVETLAEPTEEHVESVGYHTAAGQAQQRKAQRLFADNGGN